MGQHENILLKQNFAPNDGSINNSTAHGPAIQYFYWKSFKMTSERSSMKVLLCMKCVQLTKVIQYHYTSTLFYETRNATNTHLQRKGKQNNRKGKNMGWQMLLLRYRNIEYWLVQGKNILFLSQSNMCQNYTAIKKMQFNMKDVQQNTKQIWNLKLLCSDQHGMVPWQTARNKCLKL